MNRKSAVALCLSLVAIILLVGVNVPSLVGAQPGDAHDPLVTRRYVDSRINELTAQIARLEAMIGGGQIPPHTPTPTPPPSPPVDAPVTGMLPVAVATFQVYNVPEGRTIFFEAGAEIILRLGHATAVTGYAGFIDVTAGRDVTNGETIYHNHLLIVPVTDGRGIHFHTSGWILIKGGYTVAD